MRRAINLAFILFGITPIFALSITFDSNFLENSYRKGGSVLFGPEGNINYLWVYTNIAELKLNEAENWQKIRYEFRHRKTDREGKILSEKTLSELGPYNLYLYTDGIFDSNGNLFAMWDLCIRSDVVSPNSDKSSPYYSIITKIDPMSNDHEPHKTMPFDQDNFVLAVDEGDTVWAMGTPPGSMVWGLLAARLYPNPEENYRRIYGFGAHKEQKYSYITKRGNGLHTPGLSRNILGFSINQKGQFLLCDRSSEYDENKSSRLLVSYLIDKRGKLQREPYEINIEEAASRIIQYNSLSNTKGFQLNEIFTEGTRLVNYGQNKIYAIVIHKENIYILRLSDEGLPLKAKSQRIIESSKLPEVWQPDLRLWTYMGEGLSSRHFFVFGIDSLANFYWEVVPLE
jgi:hypothetical protein